MAKPMFTFETASSTTLDLDAIWPDGDAPENPTAEDVAKVIAACGGLRAVLRDWDLDDEITLTISNETTSVEVRR